MSRICLYYRATPKRDRWVPGDRYIRPIIRRLVRGRPRPGGVDKVFINLCLGLDRLGVKYEVNLPFSQLETDDRVGVLGREKEALRGFDRPNPIVAGIGLMTWPAQWPTLCEDYPIVTYLSHCAWVNEMYRSHFGDRCMLWPVGIDTDTWRPNSSFAKSVDVLIYNKSDRFPAVNNDALLGKVRETLQARGLAFEELHYGSYQPDEYVAALRRARTMIYLSSHESQGIAYQEAMSSGVPILAWDPGRCEDPERFVWGEGDITSSSVPFFDDRCGNRFRAAADFDGALENFLDRQRAGELNPRAYVLDNLTPERCSRDFVDYLNESRSDAAKSRLATRFRDVAPTRQSR